MGKVKALCMRDSHLHGIKLEDISKAYAKAFQGGDLLAWKARIAATNAIAKMDKMTVAEFGDFQILPATVLEEIRSLGRVLVRPGTTNIFGRDALVRMCEENHIPKRRSLKAPF